MSDPYGVVTGEPVPRKRRRRRVWLEGGTSTQRWGWELVVWSVMALGLGIIAVALAPRYATALWLILLVPVVLALRRSVPRGLFRFRVTDLLFGLVLGVALRLIAGWLERTATGAVSWPSLDVTSASGWLRDVLAPVVVAPVVEELFFHGLLLVAIYTVVRRSSRSHLSAGVAAALITTAAFVATHLITSALEDSWASVVSIALVGLIGAGLVLATGRIWAAVLVHVTFNGSYVLLAAIAAVSGAPSPVLG